MKTKKEYFVFVGIDLPVWPPNPQTKRKSIFGRIYKFKNNDGRKRFAHENKKSGYLVAQGGRRVMRKYCLGMSVGEFNKKLDNLNFMYKKIDGKWCEEVKKNKGVKNE